MERLAEILRITRLDEMPLRNLQHVGDFDKSSSWRHPENRAMATNPKWIEKVRKKLGSTDHVFDFYLVNRPGARNLSERGELTWEEVAKYGIKPADDHEETISIAFVADNGAERYPMTPWILAHRMGHAFMADRRNRGGVGTAWEHAMREIYDPMRYIAVNYYRGDEAWKPRMDYRTGVYGRPNPMYVGPTIKDVDLTKTNLMIALARGMGTFKSARYGTIRDYYEFIMELFAQYVTTGKITMNVPPQRLVLNRFGRKYAWRGPDTDDEVADYAESIPEIAVNAFDYVLRYAKGRLFAV
jgi:hypothetical protein